MSLRYQVAVLLFVISITLIGVSYAVQAWIVMPSFVELEQQSASRNVLRCIDGLKRDFDAVLTTVRDWSSWDDSYDYMETRNEEFAKGNLIDMTFGNTKKNFIALLTNDRRIVWADARDDETFEKLDLSDVLELAQREGGPLTSHRNVDDVVQGILLTKLGPMIIASCQMTTTKRDAPVRGTLIMGRLFSDSEVAALAERMHLTLVVREFDKADPGDRDAVAYLRSAAENQSFIQAVDEETLYGYGMEKDLFGNPALLMRIQIPRAITAQGRVSAKIATYCSISGSLLTLFALWSYLKRRILRPLQGIADHAVRVGRHDDLKARLALCRRDEIGTLAGEFDDMVARLADSRKKVLDSAHRAGMAEIASEVLHNVGNAVNSAGCSVEVLEGRCGSSKLGGLERAVSLLKEQAPRAGEFFSRDPRGPKLVDYLVDLNGVLRQERDDDLRELHRLRETIRHIREAIATQQNYAGRSNYRQDVVLADLIDEVLRLNQETLRAAEVQVDLRIPEMPELQLNKSKMTQVLVNLVRNAVQSMEERAADERRLTIVARLCDEDGIEIEVNDTGLGFDETVRRKLFTHGFTTKPEGNGFGLHYCANAVRECDGAITAESPGPGCGASFRIRLPHSRIAASIG